MKLADDIINHILSFNNPYKDCFMLVLTELKMKCLFKTIPLNISAFGVINKNNQFGRSTNESLFSIETLSNIQECVISIKTLFTPTKTTYNEHSYGSKHYVEDFRRRILFNDNPYISNGEFIVAMLLSNYKYKYESSFGPNMLFKAKRNKTIYDNILQLQNNKCIFSKTYKKKSSFS
jgi:hypothetical protein